MLLTASKDLVKGRLLSSGVTKAVHEFMTSILPPEQKRIANLVELARGTLGHHARNQELLRLIEEQCRRLLPAVTGDTACVVIAPVHELEGAAREAGAWRVAAVSGRIMAALEHATTADDLSAPITELERALIETRKATERWWRAA